jgi:hypothetical protein
VAVGGQVYALSRSAFDLGIVGLVHFCRRGGVRRRLGV